MFETSRRVVFHFNKMIMKAVVFLLLLFSAQLTSNAQTTRIGDTCSGQYLEYTPMPNKAGYHVKEWYYDRLLFEGNCREKIQVKQFDSILEKEYPENEKYFYESLRHDKLKVKMNNYFLDSFVLYDGLDNIRKKYLIDGDGYITYMKMKNLEVNLSNPLFNINYFDQYDDYKRSIRINNRKVEDTIFVNSLNNKGKFTDTLLKHSSKYSNGLYKELNNKYYLLPYYSMGVYSGMYFLKQKENDLELYYSFFDLNYSIRNMFHFKKLVDFFEFKSSSIKTRDLKYGEKYLYKKGKFIPLDKPKSELANYIKKVVPSLQKDCSFRDSIKMEDYRKGKIIKTCYDYVIAGTNEKFLDSSLVYISKDNCQCLFGLKTKSGRWVVGPQSDPYYEGKNANGEAIFIRRIGDYYKMYNCYGQDMYPNDSQLTILYKHNNYHMSEIDDVIAVVNSSVLNTFKINYLAYAREVFGTGKIDLGPIRDKDNFVRISEISLEITDYRTKQKGLVYNTQAYVPPIYSKVFYNRNMIMGFNKDSQRLDMYNDKSELKSSFSEVDSLSYTDIIDKELISFKCNLGWIVYNSRNFKFSTVPVKPTETQISQNLLYLKINGRIRIYTVDFTKILIYDADSVVLTENNFVAFKNNLTYFGNINGKIYDSIEGLQVHRYWVYRNLLNNYNHYIYQYLDSLQFTDSLIVLFNSFIFKRGNKYGLISVEGKILKDAIFEDIGAIFIFKNWDERQVIGLYFIKNGVAYFVSITDLSISEKTHHYGFSLVNFNDFFIGRTTQPKVMLYGKNSHELGKFHKIMNKEELASGEMMDYIGNRSFEKVGMKNVTYLDNGFYYYTTFDNKIGLKNCKNSTLFEIDADENFRYDIQTNCIFVLLGKDSFKLYSLKRQQYLPDTFDVPPMFGSKNGAAIVVIKRKYGLLGATGAFLIEPNYSWIFYSEDNEAYILGIDKKYELYFEKSNKLIKTSYEHIQPLYNKGFVAYKGIYVYLLDSLGNLIDSSNSYFFKSRNPTISKLREYNFSKWGFDEAMSKIRSFFPNFIMNSNDSNLIKFWLMFPKYTYSSDLGHTRLYPDNSYYPSIHFETNWMLNCNDENGNSSFASTKASVYDYSKQISSSNYVVSFKFGFSAVVDRISLGMWTWDYNAGSRIYFASDSGLLRLHCVNLIAPEMREKLETWLFDNWKKLENPKLPCIKREQFYNYIMDGTFFRGDKVVFFEAENIAISLSLKEFNKYLKPEWKGKFN